MTSTESESTFVADPYPTLTRLRESAPVSIVTSDDGLPIWLIPRYHDVRAALADPRLGQDVHQAEALAQARSPELNMGAAMVHMLNSDPPNHTRLRKLVHAAFTARRVAAMRPLVERVSNELLAALAERSTADLVQDFAFPLPTMIICELLGFPPEDRDIYRRWSTAILTETGADFQAAISDMTAYIADIMARRRHEPADDMLTDLLRANDDGELSEQETAGMVFLLLIGGHETTVNLIGTSTLALFNHPDQAAWLRANPAAMPSAIDEFLRFESPVRMATVRFTTEPVDVSGVRIPADQLVLISLAAANRDPSRFTDPDRLLLERGDPGHLAFGHGLHRCLGSLLGKLEAELALTGLMTRFPKMGLAVDQQTLPWRNTMMLRGLESLPVSLHG